MLVEKTIRNFDKRLKFIDILTIPNVALMSLSCCFSFLVSLTDKSANLLLLGKKSYNFLCIAPDFS